MSPNLVGDPRRALTLQGVSVRYPRRQVPSLRGVSLHVDAGEQILVIGPSGSGKSTLLDVITGVVPHARPARLSGTVLLGDDDVTSRGVLDRCRSVAWAAQDPATAVCLPTVELELAQVLENRGVEPALISRLINNALDDVQASHLGGRRTAELSGGELQRVGVAAALLAQPQVLLLDEPTAMLDHAGLQALSAAVAQSRAVRRTSMLLVEHRVDELAGTDGSGLPGRVVALDASGSLLADGATDDVLHSHGHRLHHLGCWLPAAHELRVGAPHEFCGRDRSASTSAPASPPMRGPIVLRTRQLDVGRGEAPTLRGLDLALHSGEIVALIGPNGSGKSSLLLTLAGLLRPLAGAVNAQGRVGFVPQNPEHALLAPTVARELAHGHRRWTSGQQAEVLSRHRLTAVVDHNPFALSGGTKRRVGLAAMLSHRRPVLLLDEPTLGLDRHDCAELADTLATEADNGTAVMFATHDLRFAATLADRLLLVDRGHVVAEGPTYELLRDATLNLPLPTMLQELFGAGLSSPQVRSTLSALDESVQRAAQLVTDSGAS